ncbi:putative RNA-directed DNA polymerase [Lupinus albus]|uniref:Putative RNA-directed DNA polymerase n=1 Tax=Lupinus albus TaxID=3870 RepID=A0A6A4QZM4_LUPAL|nr:putative RNA-directed DNA polymerase [Lupinus albus]
MTLLEDGERILTSQEDIGTHVLNYFTDLFASTNNIYHNNLIQVVIPRLVSDSENNMLTIIPTDDEIKSAVFAMNGDGAPGPDGFGGCFYQSFWDIVGQDVCNSIRQFFSPGWLLPNLNSNTLVLIPKSPNADKIEEFIPIALANFQFKIIIKVLADRLALISPRIVSQEQRGFIKERNIKDCICLASEAINMHDHKTFGGNLAIKLDIKKAFDTMDCDFLLETLNAFGFNQQFISWVRVILHSTKLSINVNGHNVGFFSCKRGVRQGDSLSPLLFCLAEDVVSRGISKLLADRKLSLIAGPNKIQPPSHVLYADDVLIFCKGIKRNLEHLNSLLSDYAQASGQHINLQKSKFYTCNASPRKVVTLCSILGFNAGHLPFNYLGIPLFKVKPKRVNLQPIADRILQKLSN